MLRVVEEPDGRIVMVSRTTPRAIHVSVTMVVGTGAFVAAYLSRNLDATVLPAWAPLPIALLTVFLLLARLMAAGERVILDNRTVVLERYLGPVRTGAKEYDLLRMHGLEIHARAEDAPFANPGIDLVANAIRFFYVDTQEWFGVTMSPMDQAHVRDRMLEYDQRLRRSLDLDPAKGLSDTAIWTSPETRKAVEDDYEVYARTRIGY